MMTISIRVLVIEDNQADRETWQRAVERHNASADESGKPAIDLLTASSAGEAAAVLKHQQVDAAVIDLRLDGNGREPENNAGNDVLLLVLERELAVTAIFTGQPTDARVPEYAREQVKIFTKGGGEAEGTGAVLAWLIEQSPLIRCIQEASALIQKDMAAVFNRQIWPRWRFWMEETKTTDKEFLSYSVARHITSHVHESISEKLKGRAHAEEWFLLPPSPTGFNTGDLVKRAEGVEIVITPRCDFATNKHQTIQLATCDDISQKWDDAIGKLREAEAALGGATPGTEAFKAFEKDLGRAKGAVASIIRHSDNKSAVHFLPRMKLVDGSAVGPLLVRFDKIRTVDKTVVDPAILDPTKRFAALSPIFLPSLTERLGNFFSRIGAPDYHHVPADVVGT